MQTKKLTHHLPNLITLLRIPLSLLLLLSVPMSWPYVVCYLLAGASDMIDGWLARRLSCTSQNGARLDSVADLVFVICVAISVTPMLSLPVSVWVLIALVALCRIVNLILSRIRYGHIVMLHSTTNRVTGLSLFLGLLCCNTHFFVWIALPVSLLALYAALEESYLILTDHYPTSK